MDEMDNAELKELYKKTFNAVADGYGHSAMGFFAASAKQIPLSLNLKGSEHVLDVATGTGIAAFSLAGNLPKGQVTGIDFSQGMLAQAVKNKTAQGINNVTFVEMDMQRIDFPDKYFDAAVSAFSIFFVEDMKNQLIHIAQKVKNNGTILTTTFFDDAFTPLAQLFFNRLEQYGVEIPNLAWKRVATEQDCIALFKEAGLHRVQCRQKDFSYFLKDAHEWWYIVWNGGFRGLVTQLSENDFEKFKKEHLAEVDALKTENGIWLEMSILFTSGENKT